MEELGIEILDEGVDAEAVAASAACCKAGPIAFQAEPDPEA